MRTRLTLALIVLAISMALIGCMSKVKYPAYYTLHLPQAADPPIAGDARASLAVREFRTNAVVDRLRASGKFAETKVYDGRSDVDLIFSGRLEKLEEVDYDGAV